MKLAFIGLGKMGFPMATHLLRAGHDLTVYNRTRSVSARLTGAAIASTSAEAVHGANMVFTCLADITTTRAIFLGPGNALAQMRPGAILIDHESATPAFARELAQAAAHHQLGFLDAPVTGGVPGATAGKLGIMAGGDPAIFAAALPALRAYGATISLMGAAGAGNMAKLVNVICGIGMGQALAEGLAFAQRAGLDMDRLIETLMAGSARSYLLEQKGAAMAASRHLPASFTVDLAINNINQTLAEAAALGAKLPLLALAGQFYAQIQAQGGGSLDTSSLIETLR